MTTNKATAIPYGTWQWDIPNDRCTYSPLWKKMLGYEESEISESLHEMTSRIHPEDVQSIWDALYRLQNNLTPTSSVTYRIKSADATYVWMNLTIQITEYNNDGLPIRLNGVQQNIDQFRKSELYLHEVNLRFSELIENYGGAVLIADEYGRVFYINRFFCEFFGLPSLPYEFIGGPTSDVFKLISNEFFILDDFLTNVFSCLDNRVRQLGKLLHLKKGIILEQDFIPVQEHGVDKGQIWIYRDITKFKKNEQHLEFRIAFEEILTTLSSRFIQTEISNVDYAINEALERVGSLIKADRSYTFLFFNNGQLMSNTHEWVNTGVTPEKDNLQNIPTDIFPWWMKQVNEFKDILLPSLDHLPPEASGEREILESQNIKSLVVVPMIYENEPVGYVGFDSVHHYMDWDNDSIKLLRILAGVLTSALKRKEYEGRLILSETRYKLVAQITADYAFAFSITRDGSFSVSWSTGNFDEITGFPTEQINSLDDLLRIVHPEDKVQLLSMREDLVQNRSLLHEYRIIKTTGEFRWISGSAILEQSLIDTAYQTLYITAKDITDRKLAEERLSEERNLLRTIIDNIPDPIYVKDLYGRKILANKAEAAILGVPHSDTLLYKSDYDYYPKDVADKTRSEDDMVIRTEKPLLNKEGFVITKAGDTRWFIGNKIPHRDSRGNVIGIVGISYDITQRKKSEDALIASEAKYRRVVNTVKEVIFQTDDTGLWSFLNPAWTEITGFTLEESIGTNFLEYVFEEDRERNTQLFLPLIRGEKEYCRHEIRYKTKSGGFRWLEVYARLLHDEQGEVIGTSGTLNDITSRKISDEEMFKALAKEKELSELKSKLISIVSHEFRTPLAAILSSSELLELYWDKWSNEKRDSLLQKIKKSIKNLIDLLTDVTEVGRFETGKISISPEDIHIKEFISEQIEEIKTGYPTHAEIQVQISGENILYTDKKLLRQVVLNLVSNAVKYTPVTKKVSIIAEASDVGLQLIVADEGIGIPEEDQKTLFEPFMRARNADNIQGTGLGLVILKRAVEMCNGSIKFTSSADQGTTFTVVLPSLKRG